MTSTKWRNNPNIIEGADFQIFDNSYWNGKDQLGPTIPGNLNDSIDNFLSYVNAPITLIDNTMTKVINTCLSAMIPLTPFEDCSGRITTTPVQNPLIDPKLLWLSESFTSIEGFTLDTAKQIDITNLQQLIAEFQENHPTFMKDTDIYYSRRNQVATYYIQQLNEYETKRKKYIDASGLFDFNNQFNNKLNTIGVQTAIQKIPLNYSDLLYTITSDISDVVHRIYNDLSTNNIFTTSPITNIPIFLNQLAIYIIQKKTETENGSLSSYTFYDTITYVNTNVTIDNKTITSKTDISNNISTIKNIPLPTDPKLLINRDTEIKAEIKAKKDAAVAAATKLAKEKNPCTKTNQTPCDMSNCNIKTANDKIKKKLDEVTQTVKKEIFNICFIPMIVLIIYNVYYFLFYKDCYKTMNIDGKDVCSDYNEFPHLESWVKKDILKIDITHPPTFINDLFLDLVFKPVTFFYTFFNALKPTCMEYNRDLPYVWFFGLSAVIVPLFMLYRQDLFNIIESIIFFKVPDPSYLVFSNAIIWPWLLLIALQRIAGVGLAQVPDPTEPDNPDKRIPRTWLQWIKDHSENIFTAMGYTIGMILFWVFKGLATYAIIPMSIWPIFFYIFGVGLFGIWNNSSDGYNSKFEKDSKKPGYKSANDIWADIDDSIYAKLFEQTENKGTWKELFQTTGKTFLRFVIPFLKEFIAIAIFMSGMITYATDNSLKDSKFQYLRNFLFISTGVIISIILGWCGLKYTTTFKHIREKYKTNTAPKNPDIPLPLDRTWADIWKEILEIQVNEKETFASKLQEFGGNVINVPGNAAALGNYTKGRINKGVEIIKKTYTDAKDAYNNVGTNPNSTIA
jgi:hypothetical protein